MTDAIGFIGLGNLGLPVATNLVDAGYALRVYNRTPEKADPLVARGAYLASDPTDAVPGGRVVATLLWDDAALEDVVTSPGFMENLAPGGVHVSMSTVRPETAQKLAAMHARRGSIYIDAPVFGRPQAAADKALRCPIAGPGDAKARVRPVLRAMGVQDIFDFGEGIGAATIVKLVGNFLIVSAGYSMQEALALAEDNGVDSRRIVDMLTHTLFPGSIYQGYGRMLAEGSSPFGDSQIPLKDVKSLREAGAPADTPLADCLHALLTQ